MKSLIRLPIVIGSFFADAAPFLPLKVVKLILNILNLLFFVYAKNEIDRQG